jgi:hypothetical protein
MAGFAVTTEAIMLYPLNTPGSGLPVTQPLVDVPAGVYVGSAARFHEGT